MGSIIYTITDFFKTGIHLSETKIKNSSDRLRLNINNIQYRLQKHIFALQERLINQFKKIQMTRSREAEKLDMIELIQNSEKIKVFQQVIYSLSKVHNQAHQLEVDPTKVSNDCVVAISSIIYVYEPLGLQQYVNLNDFIPEPHPNIGLNQISQQLQRYIKKQQVTNYELNLYVCELIKRHNISLGVINLSGHSFVPNPVEFQQATPSYEAFAVSYQYEQPSLS